MAWSSAVFTQTITNTLLAQVKGTTVPTGFSSLVADTLKVALFNNTGTPNKDDTLAHVGYNASGSPWVTANEVVDTLNSNWNAGGVTLSSPAFSAGTGYNEFTGANTPGAGTLTLTNAYGCLVYDNTISGGTGTSKQGICFNSFGGAQSVTAGSFTVVWNASGIFQITN